MNIIDSLKWRYAVKKFDTNKTLSLAQINTLKEAFNLTATSYGLQPLKLVIVKNKTVQEKLVPFSWNQQQILQASHLLVICIQDNYTTKEVENYFNLVQKVRNTPDEVINPFKKFLTAEIAKKRHKKNCIYQIKIRHTLHSEIY
jgi:nitroreductase/dihydropteridine reductase